MGRAPLSGLVALLWPLLAVADLSYVCQDLCSRLSYDVDVRDCVLACRNIHRADPFGLDNTLHTDKRQSTFVRIGRMLNGEEAREPNQKRSRFVRIGRSLDSVDDVADAPQEYDTLYPLYSGPDLKRASSFVRIGKKSDDTYADDDALASAAAEKRASSFVRIGKAFPGLLRFQDMDQEKRGSGFVRIGKGSKGSKRISSFVRIGKKSDAYAEEADPIEAQRRASSFVRIGKSTGEPWNKRMSSFVRIGKSQPSYQLFDQEASGQEMKRASSFVRIGKSPMGASTFPILGERGLVDDSEGGTLVPLDEEEATKRASSFVRIGKASGALQDKRASSFVRIGKASMTPDELLQEQDPSQKRASSFVRIGKAVDDLNDEENKRFSHFVRIGKSTGDQE